MYITNPSTNIISENLGRKLQQMWRDWKVNSQFILASIFFFQQKSHNPFLLLLHKYPHDLISFALYFFSSQNPVLMNSPSQSLFLKLAGAKSPCALPDYAYEFMISNLTSAISYQLSQETCCHLLQKSFNFICLFILCFSIGLYCEHTLAPASPS